MLQVVAAASRKQEAAAAEHKAQSRKRKAEEAKEHAAAAKKVRAEQRTSEKLGAAAFLQRWAGLKKRRVAQPAHNASGMQSARTS
jgi:hypothetical protein